MKGLAARLTTISIVAAFAVIGSLVGRIAWESVTAVDQPDDQPPAFDAIEADSGAPRFEGEILGYYIAPPGKEIPEKYVSYEDVCGAQPTEQLSLDRAGELDLNLDLPEQYKLDTTSVNTGVAACGGKVYATRWESVASNAAGYAGSVIIAQGPFDWLDLSVATNRVTEDVISGLPAVHILPLAESGVSTSTQIIFPRDGVVTYVASTGIPHTDVLNVAAIVAAAIRGET